jgi:hypothetical protein
MRHLNSEGGKVNLEAGGRNLWAVKIATDAHGHFFIKSFTVCVCLCVSVANHIKKAAGLIEKETFLM